MADKDIKVQKRGRIKAKITRMENYVKANEHNLEIDTNEFIIRESMLVKIYEDYDCIQDQLEEQEPAEEEDRIAVELQYTSLHSKLKTIIQTRMGSNNASRVQAGASGVSSNNAVTQSTFPTSQVRLPNINIPIFSGQYEDYNSFIELFTSLIDLDVHLSKAQKFLYLKSVLKNEPLSLIKDLQITDANYDVSLDLLKKRYDNKLVTINCHIRNLMEVQLTKGNPASLREFIVKIKQHYNALEAIGISVKEWDLILVYIMSSKLDFNTHKAYELERDPQVLPTFKEFLDFVEKRCQALEALATPESRQKVTRSNYHSVSDANSDYKGRCACCNLDYHPLFKCNRFSKLALIQKREFVAKHRLCYNCLGSKHRVSNCKSSGCQVCKGRHHSTLHEDKERKFEASQDPYKKGSAQSNNQETNTHENDSLPATSSSVANTLVEVKSSPNTPCLMSNTNKQILLATAMVNLVTHNGSKVKARVLLDSGSQSSFITLHAANKLNLQISSTSIQVSGIGQSTVRISEAIKVTIESQRDPRKKVSTVCGILKKITCPLPLTYININELHIPDDLFLADERFFVPGEIDALLGADVYFDIIQSGLLRLGEGLPVLQNSLLGWIVGGGISSTQNSCSNLSVALFSQGIDLDTLISQFWKLEEVSNKRHMAPVDRISEEIYSNTTTRIESGVFEVRLPINPDYSVSCLGDSLSNAVRRFYSLERRFDKDPKLKMEYKAFIDEYIALGHARDISLEISQIEKSIMPTRYYFPHHCVVREDKLTTKYRVVFDGSMKTTSGLSLNDIMLKGSPVQPELFDIISRFRTFRYVLTSDIQKMYRCIRINSQDRFLQNIIWRDDTSRPLRHIELQTVTYGTNCAPFLATRTLVELANRGINAFPLAADTLLRQTYVDDILGGASTLEELTQLQKELVQLLESAGFVLHKWNSNDRALFTEWQSENSKVLGVSWNPILDSFQVSVPDLIDKGSFTKREVLGIIAQVFDPMGFVGAVIIVAKIIMQKLWLIKIDWDEVLPEDLLREWLQFYKLLPRLKDISIPRWIFLPERVLSIQLIGFSDASMQAYGICLYVRVLYQGNGVSCNLVCSKSRVAPLKTVSLPRLELCGFLLLARMCNKFISCMNFKFDKTILFTDSQIVLAWLHSPPSRWTTFVANRVSEIQDLSSHMEWRHVSSESNPADYISRGLYPNSLINCKIWWEGPDFLLDPNWNLSLIEHTTLDISSLPEEKHVSHVQTNVEGDPSIFLRFSSFSRMQRCIAFMLRFICNSKITSTKVCGSLTVEELNLASNQVFKVIQHGYFLDEITCLRDNTSLPKKSSLLELNPFLDSNGLLRVGGRLDNAPLSFAVKHPIILPSKCHVTDLLIEHQHKQLGHAGPLAVLNSLRQRFWPVHGLRRIKNILLKCITCHRFKALLAKQLMGSLPVERVQLVRPFLHVGIDFAGPVMVKQSRLRKAIVSKAYIALFLCMATKAVHIELVSSLSTEDFLLTLKRFVSRRGNPLSITSDNATYFKGTDNSLKEVYRFLQVHGSKIQDFLSTAEISWKFIPPNSPHWGGIWEAGIKSIKYHLKRIVGKSVLSFECLSTVLAQIEAILNSRPLQPMSNSISDLSCLTPGHFLIGQPMTAFPERIVLDVPENRLNLWQHCSKLRQDFWKRWSMDYLNQLQHRPKWKVSENNLKIGDLVLLKEDNIPPLNWGLARVLEIMPGRDNKVRVVKIKTNKGEFIRPIRKLSPLPLQGESCELLRTTPQEGENVDARQ